MLSEFLFGKKEQSKPQAFQQPQIRGQNKQNHEQPQENQQFKIQDQSFKSVHRGRGRGRGFQSQYQSIPVATSRDEQTHQRGQLRGRGRGMERQQSEGMEREIQQKFNYQRDDKNKFDQSRGPYRKSEQQMSLEREEFSQKSGRHQQQPREDQFQNQEQDFRGRTSHSGGYQQRSLSNEQSQKDMRVGQKRGTQDGFKNRQQYQSQRANQQEDFTPSYQSKTFYQGDSQGRQNRDQQGDSQGRFQQPRDQRRTQQYDEKQGFKTRGQNFDDDKQRLPGRGRGFDRGRGNERGRGKIRGQSGSISRSQGKIRVDQDQIDSIGSQMERDFRNNKRDKDTLDQEEWEDDEPFKVIRLPKDKPYTSGDKQEQISGRFYRDKKPEKSDKSILKDPILDEKDDQSRSLTTSSRPQLSKGAFRMVNFEIRKNDPSIPRNACQPTVRDQEGKRLVRVQYEDKKTSTNLRTETQIQKQVDFDKPVPKNKIETSASNTSNRISIQEKLKFLKNKVSKPKEEEIIAEKIQSESESGEFFDTLQEDDIDQKSLSEFIESDLGHIRNLMLIDDKITQEELNVQQKLQFDQIFEVDYETREFKPQFAITAFFRSNQGIQWFNNMIRSVKGLQMAINYIIDNILSSDQIVKQRMFRKVWKTQEELLTFLDIFQYADDRIRTIQNDLTKLAAHINISGKMISILEKIVRFYIVSLFQFYQMKYQEIFEGASLTQIDGGITKCTKSIDESLSSLFECYIQQFDEINAALFHLQKRKTSNKNDKEILEYIQKKYKIEFQADYSEFISYLYFTHLLKPQQRDISRDTNMRINEINAKLCQSCPFYGQLIQTQELHLVSIIQQCILNRNFRKISDIIKTSGQSFQQKFLISLFFLKNHQTFDKLAMTFHQSENFSLFEYSFTFEDCLYIIQNEFFTQTKYPRKLYTNGSGYPSEFSLKKWLLSKIRKQVLVTKPKVERVNEVSPKPPTPQHRKEEIVKPLPVHIPTPKPPIEIKKLEIVQKKFKKFSKRLLVRDFFSPIADALEEIEIQLFQRLTLKKGFYQWKKFYESRRKDRWFNQLLEFKPASPIQINNEDLNDITINNQEYLQKKQKQNILYQIVERCAANFTQLSKINLKLCFVFIVGFNTQFENEYNQFADLFINSLLQSNHHKEILHQLMKNGTLESRKSLKYTTEDGVKATLQILFQFTQSQYLLEQQNLLHGCDQLFIIGSDSLQKDKLFFQHLVFQIGQSKIPLDSTIILPIYTTDQYADGKNSEDSITLSSVIKEVNESQVHNKQEILIPLGLTDSEGQSTIFNSIKAVFFKLDRVYMYFNIFENQKFKKNFLQQINSTFQNKITNEIPKQIELVPLSQVIENIIELVNQTANDDLFLEAFKNQNISSLFTVCNFAEKCLEDVYDTHLKEMIGKYGSNTILNRIPFDMQLNPKDQKKFTRACYGRQLKRTRKILMLLNPSNFLTSKIIKTIKNTLSNINGVDILNLVRKNMKICGRICKQNKQISVNFASYQRLLQNRFQFGNPEKNYLEGDWTSLALRILKDTQSQLQKSGVYFILPKDYVFKIDKQKLMQQIDEDNRNFIRDFKVIKQKIPGFSLQGSSERTDELFDLNFESYLKKVKGNDNTAFVKQVIQID